MTIARSSEGAGAVRAEHPDNHYATPASLAVQFTEFFVDFFNIKADESFTDPGVGEFPAFGYALKRVLPACHATGIESRFTPSFPVYDKAYQEDFLRSVNVDGIVYGNPPFSIAKDVLLHSMRSGSIATVLLLRHAFWESSDRMNELWKQDLIPHYTFPLVRRVPWWLYNTKHAGKKSTNTTQYAFFCWMWNMDAVAYSATIPFDWKLDSLIETDYKTRFVKVGQDDEPTGD